jgi:hypothetical protein
VSYPDESGTADSALRTRAAIHLKYPTTALNATIQQAVAATPATDVKIVNVDVTAEFAGHGIGRTDPFINDIVADAFTRMRTATMPMLTPSQPHCQADGWTNRSSWSELLRLNVSHLFSNHLMTAQLAGL